MANLLNINTSVASLQHILLWMASLLNLNKSNTSLQLILLCMTSLLNLNAQVASLQHILLWVASLLNIYKSVASLQHILLCMASLLNRIRLNEGGLPTKNKKSQFKEDCTLEKCICILLKTVAFTLFNWLLLCTHVGKRNTCVVFRVLFSRQVIHCSLAI